MLNLLALFGGATIALLVMSYPWTIAFTRAGVREPLFVLCTFTAAAGFVYGLGFRPVSTVFRFFIAPRIIFPLILLCLGWITYALYIGPGVLSASN